MLGILFTPVLCNHSASPVRESGKTENLILQNDVLTRISHKDRRERPISAVATGKRRLRGAVLKTLGGRVCPECFWGCNTVDMVLTGFGVCAYLQQILVRNAG